MRALNATGAGEFITATPIDRAIKRADGGRPLSIGPTKTCNRRDVKKIYAHAGVPTLSLYEPRHTVASLMVDSDVPLREVADLLGHKDLEMVVDPVILASTRKYGIADTTCSTPTDTRSECSASTMPTNLPSGSMTMNPTPPTSSRSGSTCSNAPRSLERVASGRCRSRMGHCLRSAR
jgi:hypothetical protein